MPPGHILQLVWERLREDEEGRRRNSGTQIKRRRTTLPSEFQALCVLDVAAPADADIHRLHLGSFGKDHACRHLNPLMGGRPAPLQLMQAAMRGSKVQFLAN